MKEVFQEPEVIEISYRGGQYVGEVKDGLPHGEGIFTYNDNSAIFNGIFENGELLNGTVLYGGSNSYEGPFKNYQPHGYGVLVNKNRSYKGEFKEGMMHGYGVLSIGDEKYVGQLKNNRLDGYGALINKANKNLIYKGEFKNGLKHGYGIHNLDGEKYTGEFSDGLVHGVGTVESNNGAKVDEHYCMGRFIGSVITKNNPYQGQDIYKSCISDSSKVTKNNVGKAEKNYVKLGRSRSM